MINYVMVDMQGRVRRRGCAQSKDQIIPADGLMVKIIESTPAAGTFSIENPLDGLMPEIERDPPSPTDARAISYPSVGDQLGAIWKAIAPLIEHPEAEAILAKIQAVKDANPKP